MTDRGLGDGRRGSRQGMGVGEKQGGWEWGEWGQR